MPEEAAASGASRTTPRVLVVDDNEDSADSLGALLEVLGAIVVVAHDGEAALRVLDDQHPDVVFLDIGMPRMDGYETCRRLKAEPSVENTVVVALTGWGQDEDRQKSRAAGFDHHRVKPVAIGELVALMSSLDSRRDGESGARAREAAPRQIRDPRSVDPRA
jgi:two-component system CheB/CheR fusion protein